MGLFTAEGQALRCFVSRSAWRVCARAHREELAHRWAGAKVEQLPHVPVEPRPLTRSYEKGQLGR